MNEKLNEIIEGLFLRINEQGKAYWGQSEGGGGVQVVTITGESASALTSSHTGAEIREMAKRGPVIAKIKATGMDGLAVFDGSFIAPDYGIDYVVFHAIMMNKNMFTVGYYFIESDSTTVTQKSVTPST